MKVIYKIHNKTRSNSHCTYGFSLIELLVGISLSALLVGIAVPQISATKASFDRLNARAHFVQDLKRAQAESITQGCRGILNISPDQRSYSFGCDYLPYDESETPVHDVQSFARTLPAHMKISSSATIIFNSRGQAIDTGYIISNLTVDLTEWSYGGDQNFASGTLLGTGVFSFN